MSKRVEFKNFNVKNILDVMYEPDKDRFSILEYNGRRQTISKIDFLNLMQHYLAILAIKKENIYE